MQSTAFKVHRSRYLRSQTKASTSLIRSTYSSFGGHFSWLVQTETQGKKIRTIIIRNNQKTWYYIELSFARGTPDICRMPVTAHIVNKERSVRCRDTVYHTQTVTENATISKATNSPKSRSSISNQIYICIPNGKTIAEIDGWTSQVG